jgi:bifunctional non-homologous end joining protein LigD
MSLQLYRKKRAFNKTPEPTGGKASKDQLRFVIQKHAASHLHYDFRLEMEGVLKSWAVPKGPSTDPSIKRLAMMVEDHPYDYRNFEGIIPKGQYGGGTVIIWDEGTYAPSEGAHGTKAAMEKDLLRQLYKGRLRFVLNGQKLKGEFALVKSSYQGEKSWLLMKVKDKYAKATDITKKDKSVVSGKTIAEVEKTSTNIYGSAPKKKATKPKREKLLVKNKPVAKGKKIRLPIDMTPMLATLVDKPFHKEGWIYEVKWDGYRSLAFLNKSDVELRSRNNKSFTERFYPVHEALKELNLRAVLDGEIVVTNDQGIPHFGNLQNWRSEADGQLRFYVFDLLWHEGYSLMELPLLQRRERLEEIIPDHPMIHVSKAFETNGIDFFKVAARAGLEGIMAKKADSLYTPGVRTKEWLKIKAALRQEVVIGGFTRNDDSPKKFSALLAGVFEKGKLRYKGKIGTGFSDKLQDDMMKRFKPLITSKNPFSIIPDINKPSRFRPNPPNATVTWLKAKLVCEVSYTEMTSEGIMRHPSFEGMRTDKNAADVKEEIPKHTVNVIKNEKNPLTEKKVFKAGKPERKTLLNPTDEMQTRKINGHELKFTNLSKIYWPREKITKRDMLNYYYQAAPYILPYLKDRPQSLNRHPNGINGESFYQKDVTGKVPDWIKTFPYRSEGDDRKKNFMVCTDEAGILYMASLGCIELNPWSSRTNSPDHPDWCIIDLDPDKNKFEQVIEAAQVTHQLLESVGVPHYCKTSGSTGLHIYIPLKAKYTYEVSKEFARVIVTFVQREIPRFTSIERQTSKRKGKIYLDFLQNRPQATLATVYSLRPKPGAPVSMPLHWEEVKKGLQITDFTIHNAIARIREQGDIFKPVLGTGIDVEKVLAKLNKL